MCFLSSSLAPGLAGAHRAEVVPPVSHHHLPVRPRLVAGAA